MVLIFLGETMKASKILGVLALCLLPANAMAASDGTIGTTSTGTAVISVTIPKLIRARSFSDFNMSASYPGTGDLNANDDLNISTNYATAGYRLTGTGTGASSAFTVTDGTQTIAYNAYFNDVSGTTGRVALATGTPLTAQTGAATTLASATLNANLSIEMLQANLQAVNAGAYTGTITLVFTPE